MVLRDWDIRLVRAVEKKIHGIIFLKCSNLEISTSGIDDSLARENVVFHRREHIVHHLFSNTHTNYGLCVLTKTLNKYKDLKKIKTTKRIVLLQIQRP